jgi:hypothetical protein
VTVEIVVVRFERISSALLAYVARLQRLSLAWGWVELWTHSSICYYVRYYIYQSFKAALTP